MRETIKPYNPNASAKIKIRIIPTKILSYYAFARTPASPTIPIARPAAYVKFITHKSLPMNSDHSINHQRGRRILAWHRLRRKLTSMGMDYLCPEEWQPRSFRRFPKYQPWRRGWQTSWSGQASRHPWSRYRHRTWQFRRQHQDL